MIHIEKRLSEYDRRSFFHSPDQKASCCKAARDIFQTYTAFPAYEKSLGGVIPSGLFRIYQSGDGSLIDVRLLSVGVLLGVNTSKSVLLGAQTHARPVICLPNHGSCNDIPFGDDIRLRRMNGTVTITSNASNKVLPAWQVLISCRREAAV